MTDLYVIDPVEIKNKQFDKEYFEEATWTSTASVAEDLGVDQQSDDFVVLYEEMRDAIDWASHFTSQLCHTSLQTLRVLLLTGDIHLAVYEDETPKKAIERVATTIATASLVSIATIKAGPDRGMLSNGEVATLSKAERSVSFVFGDENQ